jgi:hypothetical protein
MSLVSARAHERPDHDSSPGSGGGTGERSQTGERAREPLHWVLVAGWITKGIVYGLIGLLALQVAFGNGSQDADEEGALQQIGSQPLGGTLLWLVAAGLALYVVGRVLEAVLLATDRSTFSRLAIAASGVIHGGIALIAARMAMGDGGQSDGQEEAFTARLLEAPAGQWLVGLGGLAIVAVGLGLVWAAISKRFVDELDLDRATGRARRVVEVVGFAGVAARGAATALIGWFVIHAALQHDPSEANGLDDALREVADTPYGQIALAAVAIGFMAFGATCLLHARYRRA